MSSEKVNSVGMPPFLLGVTPLLSFFTIVLAGCLSINTNKVSTEKKFDFIAAKCKVGDEIEIGYPVPILKKGKILNLEGTIYFGMNTYEYDANNGKWKCMLEAESSPLAIGVVRFASNFRGDFYNSLKSKSTKITILKHGLFLVKTDVEILDSSKDNKVIYSIETSTIFDSRPSSDKSK
jgi:hypothetical protein